MEIDCSGSSASRIMLLDKACGRVVVGFYMQLKLLVAKDRDVWLSAWFERGQKAYCKPMLRSPGNPHVTV